MKKITELFRRAKQPDNMDYKTQVLEPLGGKIQMPVDWFYNEKHRGSSFVWVLSKEDFSQSQYLTGVTIQVLTGIEEKQKKTAQIFLKEFAEKRKKQVRVLEIIEPENLGMFTRFGFESLEPAAILGPNANFRVQNSLFWGNNMDLAVVMTAGTPEGQWLAYKDCFERMSNFEVIDMSRFEGA